MTFNLVISTFISYLWLFITYLWLIIEILWTKLNFPPFSFKNLSRMEMGFHISVWGTWCSQINQTQTLSCSHGTVPCASMLSVRLCEQSVNRVWFSTLHLGPAPWAEANGVSDPLPRLSCPAIPSQTSAFFQSQVEPTHETTSELSNLGASFSKRDVLNWISVVSCLFIYIFLKSLFVSEFVLSGVLWGTNGAWNTEFTGEEFPEWERVFRRWFYERTGASASTT